METKANYALIGAFTLAGFLGILGFLMWFANLELNRQFAVYDVYFPDVSGLSVSSDVQFAGVSVGKVVDMQISGSQNGAVRVRLEMNEETPVRENSLASLSPQGVTGVYAVAISPGSPDRPLLRETVQGVPVIEASRSMLQTLSDRGPEIVDRLSRVAEQLTELLGSENQARVHNILDNVERSSGNIDAALADIGTATDSIASAAANIADFGAQLQGLGEAAKITLGNADAALVKFTESAGKADATLEAGTGVLNSARGYIDSDLRGLTTRLDTAAAQLETTLATVDATLGAARGPIESAGRAFEGIEKIANTDVGPVMTDLRATLGTLNTAIASVSDDLPQITGQLRSAAESAGAAFGSLQGVVEGMRGPAQTFAREGLPQFSRLASDMRGLVDNASQLVSTLRRNPSQLLSGQRTPEFRR